MFTLKRSAALLTSLTLTLQLAPAAQASAYEAHPKIVVIVVIDQFRADYLERYRADLKAKNGFRLLLDRGAYFPDCYYDYANTKTAPGHATIGTGAYTDGHGIGSNEWWDLARNKQRPISSVEDDRYGLVGLPAPTSATPASPAPAERAPAATQPPQTAQAVPQAQTASPTEKQESSKPADVAPVSPAPKAAPGSSPRNLLATTVGDELRLATNGASKVWGISLKDRAAILPAGSAANGAFWIDGTTGRFVTSTYYMQQLPAWAATFNDGTAINNAEAAAGVQQPVSSFYNQVGRTSAANAYELAFAEALIAGEQLGKHATTDLVTISLSPTDILGHQVGPDSAEEHAMVEALDTDLDGFFSWLDKNVEGGLGNVWVALTADHGIAPIPAVSSALGIKGAYVDLKQVTASLNDAINQRFSPGENQLYMLPQQELPYLALNEPVFARAGINEQEAERAVADAVEGAVNGLQKPDDLSKPSETRLPPRPRLYRTYTRLQLEAGELPHTEFGELLAHSYTPSGGWYVMAVPIAYQMEGSASSTGTTHYSPWSYDRHVPLGFFGAPFAPGVYHGRVAPVDLAATFASLLGVNQPSASVGHILTQALKPASLVVYPKELPPPSKVKPRPGRGRRRAAAAIDDAAPAIDPSAAPTPSAVPPPVGTKPQ